MGQDLKQMRHQHKWLADIDVPHSHKLRHGAFTFEIWKKFGSAEHMTYSNKKPSLQMDIPQNLLEQNTSRSIVEQLQAVSESFCRQQTLKADIGHDLKCLGTLTFRVRPLDKH